MSKVIFVPTPIGNLGDVTSRAIDAFNNCDVIYCEDTRVTYKLLNALGIKKPLQRMDENAISEHVQKIIADCAAGKQVCYCTDAGMPGISDPGSRIVGACREANVEVEVLPGANAALVALVASGFDSSHFYFEGFLPKKKGARDKILTDLLKFNFPTIIYESPKRVFETVSKIGEIAPKRRICVARELTKMHEGVLVGTADEVLGGLTEKGEFVIVIDKLSDEEVADNEENRLVSARLFAKKQAARGVAPADIRADLVEFFGCSKNEAYEISISH